MKPTMIDIENLKASRSGKLVLSVPRFQVAQGELVAIIGPNGAGKSSLLQVINGLLTFQEGRMRLLGNDFESFDKVNLRRRCAMVFQEPLFVQDTVFENVALPLRLRGWKEDKLREKVASALATFRCANLAQRLAHRLSGGEAQRVCLARAFVTEPELLLLDEPFTALDPVTRSDLLVELRQVALDRGITVLLISHNLSEVLHFTQRAVVMEKGTIVQDDIPERVMRCPATLSVARLVGMDNILPCEVKPVAGGSLIQVAGEFEFIWEGKIDAPEVNCCLPGDVFLLSLPAASGERLVSLKATVRQIIPGIGVYQVKAELTNIVLTLRISREEARSLEQNAEAVIVFDPRAAHIIA